MQMLWQCIYKPCVMAIKKSAYKIKIDLTASSQTVHSVLSFSCKTAEAAHECTSCILPLVEHFPN